MSKTNKKSKSNYFTFPLAIIPNGKLSLAEFISSEAGELAVQKTLQLDESLRAFAFLCAYQAGEICYSIQELGEDDILDNEVFQERMADAVENLVRENFIEILMALQGQVTNLLAKREAQEGGV